jgi:hypothetical protein
MPAAYQLESLPLMPFPRHLVGSLVVALALSGAWAASPHKEPVVFSISSNVGLGNSVFVVGNHPDLGNNDVT